MVIQTNRLIVRPIEEDDWSGIRNIWIDFNASEYVFYDNPKNTDPKDVKKRIATWAEVTRISKDHMFFVACLDGEVIGFTSMNRCGDGYEIGYGFLNSAHGKGYAKESLEALLEYMSQLGVKKVLAGTAIKNTPSVNLLKRLGFELVETERIAFHKDAKGNDIFFEGGNFEKQLA